MCNAGETFEELLQNIYEAVEGCLEWILIPRKIQARYLKLRYENRFRQRFLQTTCKKGWVLARINGSHHVYTKQGTVYRISVPVHKNKDLKTGLLRSLMKITEITEQEL
jgi:predicted RNA binding protein YcfA (HicA-like mRNA interferase family)